MCLKECKTLSCGRLQISGWGFERQRRNHDGRFSKTGIFTQTSLNKMCANDWCWLNACVVRVEQHDFTEYSGKTNSNFFYTSCTLQFEIQCICGSCGRSGFVCFSLRALTYEVCCYIVAVFWGQTTIKFHNEWKRNKTQRTLSGLFFFFSYIGKPCQNL